MPNLNDQAHFSQSPLGVDINRSKFDRSHGWKGTSKSGQLNVDFIDEILPGDTVDMRKYSLTRSVSPFTRPVMDNAFREDFIFFVPDRLVWDNFKAFMGEGDPSQWTTPTNYTVPQCSIIDGASHERKVGDLADQMGLPILTSGSNGNVTALPFRGYKLIWNEWFRDENLQNPVAISKGDTETQTQTYFHLLPTGRIHDYFGSCLPGTQKGDAVKIALSGVLPVTALPTAGLGEYDRYGSAIGSAWTRAQLNDYGASTTGYPAALRLYATTNYAAPTANVNAIIGSTTGNLNSASGTAPTIGGAGVAFTPANLVAKLNAGGTTVGIDVNALRLAVQTQRILEKMALGGSRYVEFVKSMFGVVSPDARQQRPELLGYSRKMISQQEIQNTANTSGNPLGLVGGNVKSSDGDLAFTHSFTEHGYLFGLFTIRENRSYSQGIDAMWKRKQFGDFYLPALAHIGEQPVYAYEIYANANSTDIFGYQEAWASYRYKPSHNTGYLNPVIPNGFGTTMGDVYTFGDVYNSQPTLSDTWIQNGNENIHRTLTITDTNAPDWLHDTWFDYKHTRCMPVYSIPGLVDHF